MLTLLQDKMDTPLGPLWVLCDEQFNLRAVEWDEHRDRMETLLEVHYRREGYQRVDCRNPGGLSSKLSDYFAGDLAIIETLPTATAGTPFQRQVWQALRDIPCGQVMHYGQLAEALGRPGAARDPTATAWPGDAPPRRSRSACCAGRGRLRAPVAC